ncbi:MAG: hypothetical protein IPO78_14910 [Saprospiraceae bacterium]|nr:hypothetical protein [Saprospiraceae bacterium]MBK9722885.1 hypothetical protein [Saprospiraceae bacterium]
MKSKINVISTLFIVAIAMSASYSQSKHTAKITSVPIKTQNLLLNSKMSNFKPEIHGLKFVNDIHWELPLIVANGPVLAGACGGMSYTMLDYYFAGKTIPQQMFRPYNGSTLGNFIEDRQKQSILSNVDKWAELIVNPFGTRTTEFFNWGIQGFNGGRLQELKEIIDSGRPAVLGLFKAGSGGTEAHHQVIAIGYQLGRYKGDLGNYKEDLKIFICDPNFPNRTMTLVPDPSKNSYHYKEDLSCSWITYFVDKNYRPVRPPQIQSEVMSKNGNVGELLLEFYTGADDLRGGNDNLNATVYYKNGKSQKFENLNKRVRWIDNYYQIVPIRLEPGVKLDQIKSVVLQTTFGGGIGGDNWNMDSFRIIAKEGSNYKDIFGAFGKPLVRFDGNNKPFEAKIIL